VEAMKIDDTPRATSKNLDVLKEFEKVEKKNEANFVVIGMKIHIQMPNGKAKIRRSC
jgi:hypothetical protein